MIIKLYILQFETLEISANTYYLYEELKGFRYFLMKGNFKEVYQFIRDLEIMEAALSK